MSLTKRWLEDISEKMGLEGEITEAVIERAQEIAEARADAARDPSLEELQKLNLDEHSLERAYEDGRLDPNDL